MLEIAEQIHTATAALLPDDDINKRLHQQGNDSSITANSSKEARRDEIEMAQDKINVAMALLPDDITAAYREACRWAPELIEKESNPSWFLRFHKMDPLVAALRLANYWKKRKQVFQERALFPINSLTGQGAMTADDVRILQTGYCINLPRDKKHRTVLYLDVSKRRPDITPSNRTIFFILQCVMENETSRNDAFIILLNISNPFAANFKPSNCQCLSFLLDHCVPIKQVLVHVIHIPAPDTNVMPSFIDTVFTWGMDRVGCTVGNSNLVAHVACSKEDCLNKLMESHLLPETLPVSLGGSWTGGCEPWRKGSNPGPGGGNGDELTLEIETDLSCLFRNSLWLHNQAVAARKRMSLSPFCLVVPDPVWEESKENIFKCNPSYARSRRDATTDGRCGIVRVETTTSGGVTIEHTEDKKARRRRMHNESDRVRRAKERIEIEVYQDQCLRMSQMNQSLQEEQRRLERLVQDANDITKGPVL